MANILIIDDASDLLGLFTLILSDKHQVRTATDIEAAEKQMSESIPDVVFMDVNLGSEDGRQLCYVLAMDYSVSVVLISADKMKLEDYTRFGAVAVLEKPFSADEIKGMIAAILSDTEIAE